MCSDTNPGLPAPINWPDHKRNADRRSTVVGVPNVASTVSEQAWVPAAPQLWQGYSLWY